MLQARILSTTIGLLVAAGPAGAMDVVVVDDDFGPGVDFPDIQSAVNAAFEGDTILIREGSYPGFSIFAKSLDVLADRDASVTLTSAVNIRILAVGQRATLRGVDVLLADQEALSVQNCQGQVWIEDCTFVGSPGAGLFAEPGGPNGSPGARVDDSTVTFQSCTMTGGRGSDLVPFMGLLGDGGEALRLENGPSVSLYDCDLVAGDGGDVDNAEIADDGGDGGDGIFFQSGLLVLSRCSVTAGNGGIGGEDQDALGGPECGVGGDGGDVIAHGLFVSGPADGYALGSTLSPGAAGAGFDTCPPGGAGTTIDLPNGTFTDFGPGGMGLDITSPVRSGEVVGFDLEGPPGALVAIALNFDPDFLFFESVLGVVHVDLVGVVLLNFGTLPPSGELSFDIPQGLPVPPGEAFRFTFQSLYATVVDGTVVGAPSELTVLHAAL